MKTSTITITTEPVAGEDEYNVSPELFRSVADGISTMLESLAAIEEGISNIQGLQVSATGDTVVATSSSVYPLVIGNSDEADIRIDELQTAELAALTDALRQRISGPFSITEVSTSLGEVQVEIEEPEPMNSRQTSGTVVTVDGSISYGDAEFSVPTAAELSVADVPQDVTIIDEEMGFEITISYRKI